MSFPNPRPSRLSDHQLCEFILKYFPFDKVDIGSIKEFPSYLDRNYFFRGDLQNGGQETTATLRQQRQFVLKFLNSNDSSNLGAVDGIIELKKFLYREGFTCPYPIQSRLYPSSHHCIMKHSTLETYATTGTLQQQEVKDPVHYVPSVGEPHYCVSVLTFVEGRDVSTVHHTPDYLYNLGKYIGNLDSKLKGFSHSGLESRDMFYWNLCHLSRLQERKIICIKDDNKLKIIDRIFNDLELHVIPFLQDPTIQRGILHNDINPTNIIVIDDADKPGDFIINGIIDVSDSFCGPYVFELAIAVAHYMIDIHCPIKYIKPLIQGYLDIFPLKESCLDVLYYIILARVAQLYINGIHSSSVDPSNLYVAGYIESSWKLIVELVEAGKEACCVEWELYKF